MNKIYYYQQEVEIGDKINFNGLNIEVTERLIDDNPDKFIVKNVETIQYVKCINVRHKGAWTLNKIYRIYDVNKYPDRLCIHNDNGDKLEVVNWTEDFIEKRHNCFKPASDKEIKKYLIKEGYNFCAYKEDICAEIEKPIFITEDGVNIYKNEKTYAVDKLNFNLYGPKPYCGNSSEHYLYFYHKEEAEEYIKDHKNKELKYYENMFLYNIYDFSLSASDASNFCRNLKKYEPIIYWLKILQLIADDLNGDWMPDWNKFKQLKFYITTDNKKTFKVSTTLSNRGHVVYFKSEYLARKAIDIMGDNINYLFI